MSVFYIHWQQWKQSEYKMKPRKQKNMDVEQYHQRSEFACHGLKAWWILPSGGNQTLVSGLFHCDTTEPDVEENTKTNYCADLRDV